MTSGFFAFFSSSNVLMPGYDSASQREAPCARHSEAEYQLGNCVVLVAPNYGRRQNR